MTTEAEREAIRQAGREAGQKAVQALFGGTKNPVVGPPRPNLTDEFRQKPIETSIVLVISVALVALIMGGAWFLLHRPIKNDGPKVPEPFYGAENMVKDFLKDPDSAQFSNTFHVKQPNGDEILCGAVNAKNGFGGYTGYTPFVVVSRYEVFVGDEYSYSRYCRR